MLVNCSKMGPEHESDSVQCLMKNNFHFKTNWKP